MTNDLADKLAELIIEKRRAEEERAFLDIERRKREQHIARIRDRRKTNRTTFVRDAVHESLASLNSSDPVALDAALLAETARVPKQIRRETLTFAKSMAPAGPRRKTYTITAAADSHAHEREEMAASLGRSFVAPARGGQGSRPGSASSGLSRRTAAKQRPVLTLRYLGEPAVSAGPGSTNRVRVLVEQQFDGAASKTVFDTVIKVGGIISFESHRKETSPLGFSVCFKHSLGWSLTRCRFMSTDGVWRASARAASTN